MVWLETLPDDWWIQYQSLSLSSQCIHELNIELLFIVRSLMIETRIYARACKRTRLLANDFRNALASRHLNRPVNLNKNRTDTETSTISVSSLIDQLSSKIGRLELTLHWLAIDGEQPIIPDNPLPNFHQNHSFDSKQQKIKERSMIPIQLTNQSPLLKQLFEIASSTIIK